MFGWKPGSDTVSVSQIKDNFYIRIKGKNNILIANMSLNAFEVTKTYWYKEAIEYWYFIIDFNKLYNYEKNSHGFHNVSYHSNILPRNLL